MSSPASVETRPLRVPFVASDALWIGGGRSPSAGRKFHGLGIMVDRECYKCPPGHVNRKASQGWGQLGRGLAHSTLPIPNGLFMLQLTAPGLRASASPPGNETPLLQNAVFNCDEQTLK